MKQLDYVLAAIQDAGFSPLLHLATLCKAKVCVFKWSFSQCSRVKVDVNEQ